MIGETEIHVHERSELSSILPLTDDGKGYHHILGTKSQVERVSITTLDAALADFPTIDLLKIDVQGYEAQVFAGAHQTLQRTKVILVEVMYRPYYESALDFGELLNLITSIAPFRIRAVSQPRFSLEGEPLWADAVFVRSGIVT